jgi:predicted anti-sigma-YlaC factor YlaD
VSVINTVNKCNKYNELISAYIDNELNEDDRAVLDAHLETCDECRKYLKLLQSVSSSAGNTLVQPPEKLAEGIMYKANWIPHISIFVADSPSVGTRP